MNKSADILATGRRKTSVAAIRLRPGTGKIVINRKPFEDYFPTAAAQNLVLRPLEVASKNNVFDIDVKAIGGGVMSQAGALSLAIARALLEMDENIKELLREHGLLTRDPRMKERKKSGQPGARKRFQFSKR